MTRKRQRMIYVVAGVAGLMAATLLVLFALEDSVVYFYGPTEFLEKQAEIAPGITIRIGGLVEADSLQQIWDETAYRFRITDLENSVSVDFYGILPTLFREGQGVIAIGTYDEALGFQASDILAKHDESYVSAEVVDVLKASGEWRGE